MSSFAFEPSAIPALPIVGSGDLFPVHRVYCIGRNYAAHAVEMGHDPDREPPFFFQKNPDNLSPARTFRIRRQRATCITRSKCLWR